MRKQVCLDSTRIFWPAILGAILVSCAIAEPVPSGEITVSYGGGSKSRVILILDNASTQAIYFRGTKSPSLGTNPWDTAMECTSTKTKLWDQEPFGLPDGKSQSIKVSPGERIRLSVYGFVASFAVKHKGDLCICNFRTTELSIQRNSGLNVLRGPELWSDAIDSEILRISRLGHTKA